MARFDGVHAFGYNSTESEVNRLDEIWSNLSTRPELILADFSREQRNSDSGTARRNFVFLSGKG